MLKLLRNTFQLILLLLIPTFVMASSNDGVLAGAFLRMGLGARSLGMGGAFTAVADGPEATYYNPGGMPFIKDRTLIASYRFLSLDRNFNYIGYAQNVKPKVDPGSDEKPFNGGLALSWIYAGVDNIDGRDSDGEHTGLLSNSENAFSLSFGLSPIDMIGVGLTAKVLYNRIPDMGYDGSAVSDFTLGMDFGILVKPLPFLSLGLMIKNLNAKYEWKTEKVYEKDIEKIDRFPRTYRGGIAIFLPYKQMLVAVDLEDNNQQHGKYYVGIEAQPISNVVVRTGLNNGNFAGGAGYQFHIFKRRAHIQYALVTKDYDVSSEHVFSWTFMF